MTLPLLCSLTLLAAGALPCEVETLATCRELLLAEVNAERHALGLDPVEIHPVLETLAQERATQIATGESIDPTMAQLQATTRRLYREGYRPHDWTEGALVGKWSGEIFEQWHEVDPRWYEEVRAGDYEHVGIGIDRLGVQPVFTLLFGLTKRTLEWRLAAPLANLAEVRREMLGAVNARRREKGQSPLTGNPILDVTAQRQAEDMLERSYYDHRSPEGGTVESRVREAGYGRVRMVGENIAKGLFTPTDMVQRWMASPDHRDNILEAKAEKLGIGVAFGDNDNGFEVVWVQVFASAPAAARKRRAE